MISLFLKFAKKFVTCDFLSPIPTARRTARLGSAISAPYCAVRRRTAQYAAVLRSTARRCGQAAYVNVCKLCEVDT